MIQYLIKQIISILKLYQRKSRLAKHYNLFEETIEKKNVMNLEVYLNAIFSTLNISDYEFI